MPLNWIKYFLNTEHFVVCHSVFLEAQAWGLLVLFCFSLFCLFSWLVLFLIY